jgi:hypothetical protein
MKRYLLAALLLVPFPAVAQVVCPACEPDLHILVEVPVENKNYSGPTKYEGDIFDAFGKQFTVEIVFDGALKPVVTQVVFNPGKNQFIRWTTQSLKLSNGLHTMTLTITDLAQPNCPDVRTIHFRVFGN